MNHEKCIIVWVLDVSSAGGIEVAGILLTIFCHGFHWEGQQKWGFLFYHLDYAWRRLRKNSFLSWQIFQTILK